MKKYQLKIIILAISIICCVQQANSQDSSFHPYHVNYWVTGSICAVGLTTNYIGIPLILHKPNLSQVELDGLNKDGINSIDKWAFNHDPKQRKSYEDYSNYTLSGAVTLPILMLFDKKIRKDWSDVLLMYIEVISVTSNIYEWTFLGPTFINKMRPIAYYDQLTFDERKSGNHRNSFYSGHVATVAAASFFMAKVISDYNPEIGNNKYFLYAAATIPPLVLGYLRVMSLQHFPSDVMVGLGVGALCGILIPELHRFQDKSLQMGFFASPASTGIALQWQPDFLK